MNMKKPFEIIGYFVDYRSRGKYIGSINIDKPDREIMGYQGRKTYPLENDTIIKKRKYKKGTIVTTECYPMCGKFIGTQEEKITAMLNSRIGYEKI